MQRTDVADKGIEIVPLYMLGRRPDGRVTITNDIATSAGRENEDTRLVWPGLVVRPSISGCLRQLILRKGLAWLPFSNRAEVIPCRLHLLATKFLKDRER